MIDRQLPHSRMTTQTLRREPPSAWTRQPALPAAECGPRLGLDRPREHPNHQSTILRLGRFGHGRYHGSMFEIGNSLREARLRRELELADAEHGTKIRGKYLRALEDERFELLPSHTYVKGFLRSYAEFL